MTQPNPDDANSDVGSTTPCCKKRSLVKTIFVAIAAIALLFVVVVAMRPSEFHVARSATISAPPEAVFAQVNNFHNWQAWSPWAKMDPAAKISYDGPTSGTDAVFRWAGNSDVGEGSMTITESRPNEFIRIRLDFVKPFAGTSIAEFTFKPVGDQTAVTWSIDAENNFIAKAIGLFIDCEKMCGDQFDQGLASMKSVVESANKP